MALETAEKAQDRQGLLEDDADEGELAYLPSFGAPAPVPRLSDTLAPPSSSSSSSAVPRSSDPSKVPPQISAGDGQREEDKRERGGIVDRLGRWLSAETYTIDEGALDEPVLDTLRRDGRRIGLNARLVLLPFLPPPRLSPPSSSSSSAIDPEQQQGMEGRVIGLRESWDLWGPLFVFLGLALCLSLRNSNESDRSGSEMFSGLVSLFFLATLGLTLNTQLLGGRTTYFLTCASTGYALLPLLLLALLHPLLSHLPLLARLPPALLTGAWSTHAALRSLPPPSLPQSESESQSESELDPARRRLMHFPVLLFSALLAWLVFLPS